MKKLLFILFTALVLNVQGQSLKDTWYAMSDIYSFKLRIILQVDSTENGYQVTADLPDWEVSGIEVTDYNFDNPYFRFALWNHYFFDGFTDRGFTEIYGELKYEDEKQILTFIRDSIPPDETSVISIKARYNKQELYIPMRDGVKLFTSIYTPKDTSQAYPMLLMRTPYGTELQGQDSFTAYLSAYYRYTRENYILVFQDVRGRFLSEGQFEDIRPFNPDKKSDMDIDEASDTYDAVDWLVKNAPHNNGNMGVMGISYPGFYSIIQNGSPHYDPGAELLVPAG